MLRLGTHQQLRLTSELSISPVLALVVALVLVFMVIGPLLSDSGTSVSGGPIDMNAPEEVARLTVDKRQSLWLEGTAIDEGDLPTALKDLVKGKPRVGVLVQIDPTVPASGLVRLMGTLKEAGIRRTAVKPLEK